MPTHDPVMVREVVDALQPARCGLFVDCTVGLGGHAEAVLQAGAARLIGLDRDQSALSRAGARLAAFGARVELVHADYRTLGAVLDARHAPAPDGILADLGVSSMQLDEPGRGFSFRRDEPLDMRMDQSTGQTAADVVGAASETELADIVYHFGEERFARRVARGIVRAREEAPIVTTGRLAEVVRRAIPTRGYQRIDPATRTFQALRIRVNQELEKLDLFIAEAAARLATGGRLAIVAFHSLEDRIVKHAFRALAPMGAAAYGLVTRKPVTPGEAEIASNPRARSAKLRVIERLA